MTRFYHYTKLRIVREAEQGMDVFHKYDLTPEELDSWMRHLKTAGANGLKVSNVQSVRKMEAQIWK